MSPSRTATIEFDNPTPTRRRMSGRRPTDFDAIGAKRQRASIIILDEVRCEESGCGLGCGLGCSQIPASICLESSASINEQFMV